MWVGAGRERVDDDYSNHHLSRIHLLFESNTLVLKTERGCSFLGHNCIEKQWLPALSKYLTKFALLTELCCLTYKDGIEGLILNCLKNLRSLFDNFTRKTPASWLRICICFNEYLIQIKDKLFKSQININYNEWWRMCFWNMHFSGLFWERQWRQISHTPCIQI